MTEVLVLTGFAVLVVLVLFAVAVLLSCDGSRDE